MEGYLSISNYLWIFIVFAAFFKGCNGGKGSEKRLISDLLEGYDRDARPVKNASDISKIFLRLVYRQLQDLHEPSQTVTSLVGLTMRWNDAFLTWNSSDYGGLTVIYLDPSRVWKPDLTLYNNAHENGGDLYNFNTKIKVENNGTLMWNASIILKSVCIIDVSQFPFDEQECELRIGSWAYDGLALDLDMLDNAENSPDLRTYVKNTEWKLISGMAVKNTLYYPCCPAPYHDISFKIRFGRKHLYYITTIVFPCLVLSLLSCISFLFPPASGERVTLVISVLLGHIVFMLIVNETTPVTSDSVPVITRYFMAIQIVTFFTLFATSFILRMHHVNPLRPVPRLLAKARDLVAVVFCTKKEYRKKPTQFDMGEVGLTNAPHGLNLRDQRPILPTKIQLAEEKILRELQKLSKRLEEEQVENDIRADWDDTMIVFDKLFFCCFLVVCICLSSYILSFIRM